MLSNVKISDYRDAVNEIVDFFSSDSIDKSLKPVNIIRNGSISSPGVSDLDLIFVFNDDFIDGDIFYKEYCRIISQIKNKDIFFVHDPMILNETLMKVLPYYTKNPVTDFEFFLGDKPDFLFPDIGKLQACLVCIEFIQFRIIQLVSMLAANNISTQGVLLRGHSLKHSMELCQYAGIDLTNLDFSGFDKVELLRGFLVESKPFSLSVKECKGLYEKIIIEFHNIYKKVSIALEEYVDFYSPESLEYFYDSSIIVKASFDYKNERPSLKEVSGRYEYQGFSWLNIMLKNIYFNEDDMDALVVNENLSEEVSSRREFFKKIWQWNYTNFKTVSAGLSPMPCVSGKELEMKALRILKADK